MTNVILHKKFVDWNSDDESKWIITNTTDPSEIESSCGDLFIVVDPAYVNPLAIGEYGELYVTKENGSIVKAPRLPDRFGDSNWLSLWDYKSGWAIEELIEQGCKRVKARRLALFSCNVARLALHLIPRNRNRLLSAIETVESWIFEEKHISEIYDARTDISDITSSKTSVVYAIYAVRNAISVPISCHSYFASEVVCYAINAKMPKDISYDVFELFNKYIPVSVAILAELGEQMPL